MPRTAVAQPEERTEEPDLAVGPSRSGGPARTTVLVVLAVLAAVAFGASIAVDQVVHPLGSGNSDEPVYAFQAELLLDGRITMPVEDYGRHFRPWLTGERDGRYYTMYQLGLPAFLAASEVLLGSMELGLAVAAALLPVVAYGFAREVLGDRVVALVAAVFATLSPIYLLHGGLMLTYTLSTVTGFGFAWLLLRAVRVGSRWLPLAAGVLLGAAMLTRPLDTILIGAPVLALAVVRLRRLPGAGRRSAEVLGMVALGAAPFVVATLLYNWRATGAPLSFPNSTADPMNNFGFGRRRLMRGLSVWNYGFADAVKAMWENIRTVPSWIFGGPVLLVAAAVGLVRGPGRAVERAVVAVVAVLFPLAYLSWWATRLSAEGALNGIGPHYYVPAFLPLAVLGAAGVVVVARRWRHAAPVAAVVLVAVTGWAVPDKLETARYVTESLEQVASAVPADLDDALVFLDTGKLPYVMADWPFLRNRPDLTGPVLYAADLGPRNADLLARYPDRTPYRLARETEIDGDRFVPSGRLQRLQTGRGEVLRVRVEPTDPSVEGGELRPFRRLVDADGARATSRAEVVPATFTVGAEDSGADVTVPREGVTLEVGLVATPAQPGADPARWYQRISVSVDPSGDVVAILPGKGFHLAPLAGGDLRLRQDVTDVVDIEVTPVD